MGVVVKKDIRRCLCCGGTYRGPGRGGAIPDVDGGWWHLCWPCREAAVRRVLGPDGFWPDSNPELLALRLALLGRSA